MNPYLSQMSGQEILTFAEAQALLPDIRRTTREFHAPVERLISRLQSTPPYQTQTALELERQLDDLIRQWNDKIRRLGALPRGLWTIDFNCGQGYYSWKYPEPGLFYWRSAHAGPGGRKLITQKA